MKTRSESLKKMKLRSRILFVCAVMFLVSFFITARNVLQTRSLTERMEESFLTNRQLLEVQNGLQQIETDVETFLNTRSNASLEAYYEHVRTYEESIRFLHTSPSAVESDILEKNVVRMSESYLAIADRAITEKRGRDIDAYQATFVELTEQFRFLNAMIATLNNRQFEKNAISNDAMLLSAQNATRSQMLILGLIALLGIFLIIMLGRMVDPIESEIHEREIRMETQVKDAELKYLRAQINPHFLFNTLNAGTQLAMMEGADRTYQYLHKVADFYRYLVREEGAVTTLQKEIEIVDDFMYIINVRYGGDIAYEKDIDASLLQGDVPSMILQPLVENCTKHGFAEKEGEKTIRLKASRGEENEMRLFVSDNGGGMSKEMIEKVLSGEENEAEASDANTHTAQEGADSYTRGGVGLRNVLRRLRMYYNKEDVMEITSSAEGTTILLKLPLAHEETDV